MIMNDPTNVHVLLGRLQAGLRILEVEMQFRGADDPQIEKWRYDIHEQVEMIKRFYSRGADQ
jgi:hypothetical protein